MVEILSAILVDGLEAVDAACAAALADHVHSSAVILNILARRREPPPTQEIATPEGLQLACEPKADCARYDSIRGIKHGKIRSDRRDGEAEALRHEIGL